MASTVCQSHLECQSQMVGCSRVAHGLVQRRVMVLELPEAGVQKGMVVKMIRMLRRCGKRVRVR